MVDNEYLNDILNSVDKEIFVKYYYDLKIEDKQEEIIKMDSEPFSDKSNSSRIR